MARGQLHPAGASLVRRRRDSKHSAPHRLSHLFDGCDAIQNDPAAFGGPGAKATCL
jgi:hypothetical protein